jgi:hypothetical protein
MSNYYKDEYGRFHDKPTNGIKPSSNNGFIYSAYASQVNPHTIDRNKIIDCINKCTVSHYNFRYNRHPKMYMTEKTPFNSRDEVMGMLSLTKNTEYGRELYKRLKANYWNFYDGEDYVKEPLTLNKIMTAADILYTIKDEHRNTVWKERHTDAYCLAFRLPPSDIYYLKKLFGDKPNILETVAFYAETIQHAYGGEKSPRMITWLKIKDLGLEDTILGRKVIATEKERFTTYFGKDHPLTKKIGS